MLEGLLAKLKPRSRGGERSDRVSIVVPFLIIAAGVAMLAWRSNQLSDRMERGANSLAVQYASFASEITARRADNAIRGVLTHAAEEWQQIERHTSSPNGSDLQGWINNNDWIVSAIYVPDADPANSIYISELQTKGKVPLRLPREFYTSSGTVRYMYDPERLLARVHDTIKQQPIVPSNDPFMVKQRADLTLIRSPHAGLEKLTDGFAVITPLSQPLTMYGVRAVVRPSYIGSGWENQGVISLILSFVALALTGVGAVLTFRGLRKEAEMVNLRGALIANVSHELRTPLSMIRLGAETLKRGARLKEHEREQIEDQILRESMHLSHLVENVLDVARMQHGQSKVLAFTPVLPRDLVRTVVTTYESWIRSKGFTVTMHLDETIDEQLWDREAVSRALLNLIDNAIKYSDDVKAIEVVLRQADGHVILEVQDSGIGIDQKELVRIFDPYYRAQFSDTQTRRGAGLGLTLVQQILDSHGGRVEVESEPGRGSTFRLIFPFAAASQPRVAPGFVGLPETF
ncbi:MAG TPA: HAMP domain-containing sensor histidine kinase [Thermoanaerobaculia bacterium]|nr:HAMP domain-containing sensor histidine kinase [Thermoanaerobaculia bacterium]